jgi:hypothetical protein
MKRNYRGYTITITPVDRMFHPPGGKFDAVMQKGDMITTANFHDSREAAYLAACRSIDRMEDECRTEEPCSAVLWSPGE